MDTTLTVFISSKMQEFAAERTALYELLTQMSNGPVQIKPWAYEKDAHAANYPIRDLYLKILEGSDLYIGLFWQKYGEWTIDEFNRATEWHIDRLLFVKADEPANREASLNQFLESVAPVDKGIAPVWYTDVDDLRSKVENSLKVWINEKLTYRPGSANAVLVTDPDDVPHQPRKLIGRDDLLAQVQTALSQNSRVLLQGFGGMGKTALAATATADYMKSNPGPMLWQEIGKESSDAIFEALARPFNAVQPIAREQGEAKIKAMRALLRERGVKLLVLDNAWDGPALKTVLEAVPRDVPVIVTSRHAYPLDMRIEVDELTPASAVATLAFYAGKPPLIHDSAAAELCQLLGYLAFALEIAGKQLMVDKLTPAQLKTRIESAPHNIEMPLEFADEGRRRFADLMETSLATLDEQTRNIYLGFGAFFAPQVTPQMLKLYELGQPKIINDNQILIPFLLFDIDSSNIEAALNKLRQRGLVQRTDGALESVTSYCIHDLAYSYLVSQIDDNMRTHGLDACLTYMELHNEPSLENFAALLPELDNLIGAAVWAYTTGRDAVVERFAWGLYDKSEFLDYLGYYGHAARLLQNAAHSAQRQGNIRNQGAHLGNLGNVYSMLGKYSKAIEYLEQILQLSRQMGIKIDEATSLGNLGIAYFSLDDHQKAIDFHSQALAIQREIGDKRGEGHQLGNLGNTYFRLGDYQKAIDFHSQALAIQREIGDKRGESSSLGNLGGIYAELGNYRQAINFFQKALVIQQQIGDKRGEGNQLGNLGSTYAELGDNPKAIEYYQQARAIFIAIGVQHLVEQVDCNIAEVQAKLAGGSSDANSPPATE